MKKSFEKKMGSISLDIDLNGLKQNSDSLYTDKELQNRLQEAIAEYDSLVKY